MRYFPKRKQAGFSLIEMLISMAIGLVIAGAMSSTFIMQQKIYDIQDQITEAVQMTRAAMDMICREVRMAGYDPTDAGFDGIPYSTTQLQILSDLTGNGDTSGPNENITYKYYDATDQIKRNTGGGFQPFGENISAFAVAYLDSGGNPATSAASIRQTKITITTRTAKPDPDYQQNNGYRTITLTNLVTSRNLDY